MKLILTNGYPYPFPANLTEEQDEALAERAGNVRLEIAGVTHFEWVHTITVEFATTDALQAAHAATGWARWGSAERILEAKPSPGDGYAHPAIIAGDTAYCGFILVEG